MTRILINGVTAWVLAICLLPATCSAGTVLNFTFDSAGSSGTVSGGFLTSLTEDISTVAINGTSYSGLTDQLTVTSTGTADTFAISGALNGALAGVTGTWLIFETQPSVATAIGAGEFVVTYGNGTSLDSVSSVLASDLGVTFTTGAGGVSLGTGNGALIDQGGVTSNVLSPTLSSNSTGTPEPSSCLMLGTGLFVMFMVGRKTFCGPPASWKQSLGIFARGAAPK
jgi:hypothetical protein